MNKYDTYLDRGRLFAVDQDSGETYRVLLDGSLVMLSSDQTDSPFEIYEEAGVLKCIHLDRGHIYGSVELQKY